jgi:hypothetical protein
MPEVNDDAFEFLLARAGLSLSKEQKAELKELYAGIAAMAAAAGGIAIDRFVLGGASKRGHGGEMRSCARQPRHGRPAAR